MTESPLLLFVFEWGEGDDNKLLKGIINIEHENIERLKSSG